MMHNPSAELNAYILDYKARKTNQGSHSIPNKYSCSNMSFSNRSWLQEVLTMPDSKDQHKNDIPQNISLLKRVASKDSSVAKWLHNIDDKISKQFPHMGRPGNKSYIHDDKSLSNGNLDHLSDDSDQTLELLLTDPKTGILDSLQCASFDSHPNMGQMKNNGCLSCEHCIHSKAPKWIEEVINEDICGSCLAKENAFKNNSSSIEKGCCHHSVNHEQSIDLIETDNDDVANNLLVDNQLKLESDKKVTCSTSPEANRIMNLIEHAIGQLREVKVAVEENTVSSLTSDFSRTSQVLSEIPTD